MLVKADARDLPLPDESVRCVVTSPPYWGLRDYGVDGQIGLEPTPDEYVANMVAVFRELRRVLTKDGTAWLNLGDSYASNPASGGAGQQDGGEHQRTPRREYSRPEALKQKDLVGIPWRVAFALQADGWWLRSDIIWAKPNPMPESVTDRPTKAHEYIFLLAKSERYYFDAEAVAEESTRSGKWNNANPQHAEYGMSRCVQVGPSRNTRTVWTIATQPYAGAHFATFPQELAERCIKAGSSERGCCPDCGAAWTRVTERVSGGKSYAVGKSDTKRGVGLATAFSGYDDGSSCPQFKTTGWRATCDHGLDPVRDTVLDPFCGSGTTVKVATKLGRKGIGCDINPEYLELAEHRVQGLKPPTDGQKTLF